MKLPSVMMIASLAVAVSGSAFPGSADPQPLSLSPGEVFRILSPNGGETYNYGDTLVCTWLQNSDVCEEAIIKVTSTAGLFWCAACGESQQQWLVWPRDSGLAGIKSFEKIDSSTIKGTYRLPIRDMYMGAVLCSLTFRGDEMKIRVYDEYAPADCENCWDLSDGFFSIRGSNGVSPKTARSAARSTPTRARTDRVRGYDARGRLTMRTTTPGKPGERILPFP